MMKFYSGRSVRLAALLFALAAGTLRAELSPEAQAAMKKGIIAAKVPDYLLAIRHFQDARKLAPEAPEVFYNLGLAESKIPGRELRSICWFEAYLTLVPNADNAPAVRQQISNLEDSAKGNVTKLIEVLKVLAPQLPSRHYWVRRDPIAAFAALYVKSGDSNAAEQLIQNQSDTKIQTNAREEIVNVLAQSKRIAEAIKQTDQITDEYTKKSAYGTIASAQIEAGLFMDAKKSLEIVTDIGTQANLLLELAEAEHKAGQNEDAEARFEDARSLINKEWGKDWHAKRWLSNFAQSKFRMGQHEASATLLKELAEFADRTTGKQKNGQRMYALLSLATAENNIGRRSDALKIMGKAEKAFLLVKHEKEEELGIMGGGYRIYNNYLYFKDWNRAEAFARRPDVIINLFDGVESLKRAVAKAKAESETEVAQAAAKTLARKTLTDSTATPVQRARAWVEYVNGCLNAPIFITDFKVTMNALINFTPAADDEVKSQTIFNHVEQPAEELVDAINDIQNLQNQSNSRNRP